MIRGVFLGGPQGQWHVTSMQTLRGAPLPSVSQIQMGTVAADWQSQGFLWRLQGVTSHAHYTTSQEQAYLLAHQPALQRPEATCVALIPISKSPAWWDLAQDERRAIFEERSHHIALGTTAFPGVARRLFHSRDLGEPFDFLTWFEFAPSHTAMFEDVLGKLRESEEWQYVEREIDLRLQWLGPGAR
jgi:chlorite dismutase